jgi:four helix bundle protein
MHNIAEGFDAESNAEFIRFLRYATNVHAQKFRANSTIALDEQYLTTPAEFEKLYSMTGKTRAAIHGFIRYLTQYVYSRSSKSAPQP